MRMFRSYAVPSVLRVPTIGHYLPIRHIGKDSEVYCETRELYELEVVNNCLA